MKITKELKIGIVAVLSIAFLVAGINFLKGNSFLGGDDVYYAYFPNTAGVTAATSVHVNGVVVGKVLEVKLTQSSDLNRRVLMKFNIQDENFKIAKGSVIQAGAVDLLNKGIIIFPKYDTNDFHTPNTYLQGVVSVDILAEVKEYADPMVQKIQAALGSLDRFINSVSAFWDTTATSEVEGSLKEIKMAIHKLGNAASQIEGLVASERVKLSKIFSNVESITANLEKSNAQIAGIIGNAKTFTDELVTADFKGTIDEAKATLNKFNRLLDDANSGTGTLGKLLKDEQLYNELNLTNKKLQGLVEDISVHPERYIHFSVFGAKTKGVPLTKQEEEQLKTILNNSVTNP